MSQTNMGSFGPTVKVSMDPDRSGNYICDGTADDVQIQAALDYVNSLGGGIVHLTRGTYDIQNRVQLYSNTTLEGDGWDTELVAKNNLDEAVLYTAPNATVIVLLRIIWLSP